jgi:hypothetical protein
MQALLSAAQAYKFSVVNAAVLTGSVVLATVEYSNAGDTADIIRLGTSVITDGSFNFHIMATTATTGAVKIHFLVIN